MLFSEMKRRVRIILGEETESRYKDEDIARWINDWGKLYISKTKKIIKLNTTDTTLDATAYYSIPVLSLKNGIIRIEYRNDASSQYFKLPKRKFRHWDRETNAGASSSTGHPDFWYAENFNNRFYVYPVPTTASSSTSNLRIWYYGLWSKYGATSQADLADNADYVNIDDVDAWAICYGAGSDGKRQNEQYMQSDNLEAKFWKLMADRITDLEMEQSETFEGVIDQDETPDYDDTDSI